MSFRLLLQTTALSVLALAQPALAQQAAPAAPTSQANVSGKIAAIEVTGNQRVDARTVESYLGLTIGSGFSQEEIDYALKNLFATGFFADVKLLRSGNTLIVQVEENPVISEISFEGNDRVETADLEKEVELKPRSIYSRDKVQSDVKRILDIYRRGGRYTATVTPKVIKLDANRVNIAYEISEGIVSRVEKITFVGNEAFSQGALHEAIRTEETRWFKFLTDNDRYDPDRLLYDQELLRRFYLREGYADFEVRSAHAELSPAKDAFYVTFVISEGKQYNFGEIKIESELKDETPPNFEKLVTTHSGDIYDSSKVEETVDAMTNQLGNLGYAFVDIQPRMDKDPESQRANITYIIKPGPRVYVERINITGNVRTKDEVIRREFRLGESDPYNSAKLERTEQRLNNLNYFEKVELKNEPGSAPDKTVVNVDVQEKSTGEVNIGAGFSSTDGVLGDFGIRERNLLGNGQELKTRLTLASRRKQIELGFTEPYFMNRELSAGFDVYRTRLDFVRESSYNVDTSGVNLRLGYSISEHLHHQLRYILRQSDISDIQPGASRYIRDQEGNVVTSGIGHGFTYDRRDSVLDPSKGYFLSFDQDFAGVGGDAKFLRHEVRASYYEPITKEIIFSMLGSTGHIMGLGGDDVRINDRFFVGGDDLRGFRNAGIGPRDTTTDDALGGNTYYSTTAEVKFPLGLPEDLGVRGAVFTDVGSLWDADDSGVGVFDKNSIRASAGFGVLWNSPFGPIRVDLAHALLKEDEDQTENIRFSFGTRF